MSGHIESPKPPRSALPLADLTVIDAALRSSDEALRIAVQQVRAADIGRDLSRRSVAEGRQILLASDDRRASGILRSASPAVVANLLSSCDVSHSARMLSFLPTERQVAILQAMGSDTRVAVEKALDDADQRDIQQLFSFPSSAVGRYATPKLWKCALSGTVRDALEILRHDEHQIEVAQNCYVVDGQKLVGVIPLRRLAVLDPSARLADEMTRDVIALPQDTDIGDAAEIIQTHDFLSLPVVGKNGELLSAVRVDDLLDAALSRVGTGFLNQGAVAGNLAAQLPYFQSPIWRAVRSRLTWLVLLFVAETATGTVLRHFEDELAKVVALSFFIPLLIGTGGNAGSQTVSTIIRALALGEVRTRDLLRVLVKEMTTGLLLGLLLGSIAFGRALLWGVSYDLATCVGLTVLIVCTWANTVGAVIPLAAQAVKIDPTVVSAPLITTLVDASGLFIYLTTAHFLVAQLR